MDADFLKQVAAKKKLDEHIDEYVQAQIAQYAMEQDIESDFSYFLPHFFDQWSSEEVDTDYVLQVGNGVARYEKELIAQVNQYTQSFQYEKMDVLDQACLLLGYLEYQILHTPKELVINEMVELAKRYSDDGAPKLVNGILHSIFQALEADK